MTPELVDARAIREMFSTSEGSLARWIKQDGFPPPINGIGKGRRWRLTLVREWGVKKGWLAEEAEPSLATELLWNSDAIAQHFAVTPATIRNWRKVDPKFPPAVDLAGVLRWRASEVKAYTPPPVIRGRPRGSGARRKPAISESRALGRVILALRVYYDAVRAREEKDRVEKKGD